MDWKVFCRMSPQATISVSVSRPEFKRPLFLPELKGVTDAIDIISGNELEYIKSERHPEQKH